MGTVAESLHQSYQWITERTERVRTLPSLRFVGENWPLDQIKGHVRHGIKVAYSPSGVSQAIARSIVQAPQNEQKDCKLFSLPQELQIKIFRLLHKSPDMIRPQSLVDGAIFHAGVSPPREGEYNEQVQFSSAFRHCCPKFYCQTINILYHENVLCISVIANKSLGILNKEWQVTQHN